MLGWLLSGWSVWAAEAAAAGDYPVARAVPLVFGQGLPPWFAAVILVAAFGNAVAAAWAGDALAARRLDSHLLETFARLRYPGTAMATADRGDGLLDRLSGQAEGSAHAAAAARGNGQKGG
ncbi:MAG: hypothetical protein ACRDTH_09925 [Pseudonocardiaceae bacterium]